MHNQIIINPMYRKLQYKIKVKRDVNKINVTDLVQGLLVQTMTIPKSLAEVFLTSESGSVRSSTMQVMTELTRASSTL